MAQLCLMPFECIWTSISNIYKDTKGTIKPVYDENVVHVETKLSIALISKMLVHLNDDNDDNDDALFLFQFILIQLSSKPVI